MVEACQKKIGKMFLDLVFRTKSAGWGLGLSLAKRIIEEIHDGKLFIVESSSITGTIFELTIPSQ